MDQLIFVRKAYIPNFRPLVPFLHVKKFVVVGGWWVGVKTWILVLSFKPKLNNIYIYFWYAGFEWDPDLLRAIDKKETKHCKFFGSKNMLVFKKNRS